MAGLFIWRQEALSGTAQDALSAYRWSQIRLVSMRRQLSAAVTFRCHGDACLASWSGSLPLAGRRVHVPAGGAQPPWAGLGPIVL